MPRSVARTGPNVPVPPETAFQALCRIEQVFRLNPHWTIRNFELSPGPDLALGSTLKVDIEDYATGESVVLHGVCTVYEPHHRLELRFEGSNKVCTSFLVGEIHGGSRLTVEDTYGDTESPDRFTWHQNQLEFWVRSLSAYLRLLGASGMKAKLYRWFMDRFWIPASPSGRSISIVVWKISLVELVLILAIIIIWAVCVQR